MHIFKVNTPNGLFTAIQEHVDILAMYGFVKQDLETLDDDGNTTHYFNYKD